MLNSVKDSKKINYTDYEPTIYSLNSIFELESKTHWLECLQENPEKL